MFDILDDKGTFINSWDPRWLNCGMNHVGASSMVAWFGTLQNLVINVPRHTKSGDSTIYFALSPARGKKFRAFCANHAEDLPFRIVE